MTAIEFKKESWEQRPHRTHVGNLESCVAEHAIIRLAADRSLSADEVAKRACDVAESLVAEFFARGWLFECPPSQVQGEQQ